jgi:hypothetical protein
MVVNVLTMSARAEAGPNPDAFARLVGLPKLMGITVGAPDIAVALIDGPIADHSDLAIENIRVLPPSTGMTCASPEGVACTHGTYVAGVLHAKRNSLVPGICPGCMLLVRPIFSEAAAITEIEGIPNATMEELATAIVEVMDSGARVGEPGSAGGFDVQHRGDYGSHYATLSGGAGTQRSKAGAVHSGAGCVQSKGPRPKSALR